MSVWILTLLGLSGVTVTVTVAQCVLKCQPTCHVKFDALSEEECGGIATGPPCPGVPVNISVTWAGRETRLAWEAHLDGDGGSQTLLVPQMGRPRRQMCYRLSADTVGFSGRLEVACQQAGVRQKDKAYLMDTDHKVLGDVAMVTGGGRPQRTRGRMRRPSSNKGVSAGSCDIPESVRVRFIPRLTVEWEEHLVDTGLVILVSRLDNTSQPDTHPVTSVTLSRREVGRDGAYTFSDFNPAQGAGEYVALVAPKGCTKRHRLSASFHWPQKVVSRGQRGMCSCWSPDKVTISPHVNGTTVMWKPTIQSRVIVVGIVDEQNPSTFLNFNYIPSYIKAKEKTLPIHLEQGKTYIALVGSGDCDQCRRYRESQPLPMPISPVPGDKHSSYDSTKRPMSEVTQDKTDIPTIQAGLVIGLGCLAFFSLVLLGLVAVKIYRCRGKHFPRGILVNSTSTVLDMVHSPSWLSAATHVTILRESDEDDHVHATERLDIELQRRGVHSDHQLLSTFSPTGQELILYVSACLSQAFPPELERVAQRTVLVRVPSQAEAICHVPPDFPLLGEPGCCLTVEELLELVGGRRNTGGKTFLVASGDDDLHIGACEQLRAILSKLSSDVVYAGDIKHLPDQRDNTVDWTRRQVDEAESIVVVASRDLRSSDDMRGQDPSFITDLSCRSLDYMLKLSPTVLSCRVVVVCLGYWTDEADRIKDAYFPGSQIFTLVQDGQDHGHQLHLRPLLDRLCSDADLIERVCREAPVDLLATVITRLTEQRETSV